MIKKSKLKDKEKRRRSEVLILVLSGFLLKYEPDAITISLLCRRRKIDLKDTRVFIRHRRSENSPATTQISPAKFRWTQGWIQTSATSFQKLVRIVKKLKKTLRNPD